MKSDRWHEVLLTAKANSDACKHLLQHYKRGQMQEDLCFGLWTPSTGNHRKTAIVTEILRPQEGERSLHGNASFEGHYLSRVAKQAIRSGRGLVFMHSHPSSGWQDMSEPDIRAERDRIADVARATGKPLVGMTLGTDCHWSARFWKDDAIRRTKHWCKKVRVLEETRLIVWHAPTTEHSDRRRQRRTVDSWGEQRQRDLESLRVGIVGLGSVGSVVAEGLARIGVRELVLIDDDLVEEHNLDRLLNSCKKDIGRPKTDVAERAIREASTARRVSISTHRQRIQSRVALGAIKDCDLIFCCVDSPVARDLLNRVAYRDAIPVIDGGVEIRKSPKGGNMNAARWRAHIAFPYSKCLRCNGQYTSSDVMLELDGSWDDPSYIRSQKPNGQRRENVFCFSLATASELLNMAVRFVIAEQWWPATLAVERNLVTGRTKARTGRCHDSCTIHQENWVGDRGEAVEYLEEAPGESQGTIIGRWIGRVRAWRRQW